MRRRLMPGVLALTAGFGSLLPSASAAAVSPAPGIDHVVVINLENESYATTFGSGSPATYLTKTLVPQGTLITHYYATAHVSLPNYLAEVSGQAPNPTTQFDCGGRFANVKPGTEAPGGLGQVRAKRGCIYPATVSTVADQIDRLSPPDPTTHLARWRAYQEDMGSDRVRDGGRTCAHPTVGSPNTTNFASPASGYAARHNPFVWFHSVIDRTEVCAANVLPLGTLDRSGRPRSSGPLAQDFSSTSADRTPALAFITPSLCNDGHDEVCTSKSAAGGTIGGLVAADAWLRAWVPLLLASKVAQEGHLLVVITFDEASVFQAKAGAACCSEQSGPNVTSAGLGFGPGGGQVGALLLGPASVVASGARDTTDHFNHYSLLRTIEDLLGITAGGSDGLGHLGMAGAPGVTSFGSNVFTEVG